MEHPLGPRAMGASKLKLRVEFPRLDEVPLIGWVATMGSGGEEYEYLAAWSRSKSATERGWSGGNGNMAPFPCFW